MTFPCKYVFLLSKEDTLCYNVQLNEDLERIHGELNISDVEWANYLHRLGACSFFHHQWENAATFFMLSWKYGKEEAYECFVMTIKPFL